MSCSCKVTYGWWQRLHNCHVSHASHFGEWPVYLTVLFSKGLQNIIAHPRPADAIAPLTDVIAKKSITLAIQASPEEKLTLNDLCGATGYTTSQMIAISLRSGYDLNC